MYKLAKHVADSLVRTISQALPAWRAVSVEATLPARTAYQPTLPANLAAFAPEAAARFAAPVVFVAHHVYRLRGVHVTWDGAVFHNLRLFVPSLVHPRFVRRFQDTLLLRQWLGEKVPVAPGACVAVCHDQWSAHNYYHWLIDTLPRLLVLRRHHPNMLLLLPQELPPKQARDYVTQSAAALGFTQYLFLNTRQTLQAGCVVLPELTAPSLTQNPELVGQVRAQLLAALGPAAAVATRRVYAARSAGGVRSLLNEPAVAALLQEMGFEKVYFEQLSFLEQLHLMQETTVLVGVHGAGMTNMLFLPPEAKVVELLNEGHGDLCYFRLASCLRLPYLWVPCAGLSEDLANQSDMVVDIDLLRQEVVAASR